MPIFQAVAAAAVIATNPVPHYTTEFNGELVKKDEVYSVWGFVATNGPFILEDGSSAAVASADFTMLSKAGWGYQFGTNGGFAIFTNPTPGSLLECLITNIQAHTNGRAPSSRYGFSENHFPDYMVWNTNFWLYSERAALTGISPINQQGNGSIGYFAISSNHVATCGHAHFWLAPGEPVYFVDENGNIVSRTVRASMHVNTTPGGPSDFSGNGYTDVYIGVLDEALPPEIRPLKVLPDNWTNYLPSMVEGIGRAPVILLNQGRYYFTADATFKNKCRWNSSSKWVHSAWGGTATAGDSGHPVFMLINTNAVYNLTLFVWLRWTILYSTPI